MMRKALAVTVIFALLASTPGAGVVLAQARADAEITNMVGDRAVTYQMHVEPALDQLSMNLQALQVAPEAKLRAQTLQKQLAPYLTNDQARSPAVMGAIETFNKGIKNPNADRNLLLLDLFDGLQKYARDMEDAGSYQYSPINNEDERITETYSSASNLKLKTERVLKLSPVVQRIEIYKPTKDHPNEDVIDTVAFIYKKDGVEQQKVVYSRRLMQTLKLIKAIFYDKKDHLADIIDPDTKEEEKDRLWGEIHDARKKYDEAEMAKDLAVLGAVDPEKLKTAELTPDQIEAMGKGLEAVQSKALEFYNIRQLDILQKYQLAQLVYHLTQSLGLTYNPFESKDGKGSDITQMEPEKIQKLLNEFEKGQYHGYGLFGDLFIREEYRTVDPEKDMPESLRTLAGKATRYLGYAVDAQKRVVNAIKNNRHEERTAAMEELGQWVRLAQTELQAFELVSSSMQLEKLKDKKNVQEMQLKPEDREAAEKLIGQARTQYLPKFDELERRTEGLMLKQAASAFVLGARNARYANFSADVLEDRLAALKAKAQQMRSLYLAQRFREFAALEGNQKRFREFNADKAASENYYLEKATGGFFAYFVGCLEGKIKEHRGAVGPGWAEELKAIDGLIADLEGVKKGDADAMRDALDPVEAHAKAVLASLGIEATQDVDAAQKEAQKVQVFQTWFGTAAQEFGQNLRLFDMVNQLDLYADKFLSSKNASETQSDTGYKRALELKWLDSIINTVTFGGRDAAHDASVGFFTPEAYKVLCSPEQKERREKIRALLREEKWQDALAEIVKIDEKAGLKARRKAEKARREDLEDDGLDVGSMLTKGLTDSSLLGAQAQGSLAGSFDHLKEAALAGMAGTAVVDFAAMSALTPVFGAGLAGSSRLVGQTLKAGASLAEMAEGMKALRALERLQGVSRALGGLGRVAVAGFNEIGGVAKSGLGLGSRIFNGMATNVMKGLSFPGLKALMNNPFGSIKNLWVESMKFNLSTAKNVGLASGMIQAGQHMLHPQTSPYNSAWQAAGEGFLGGAAFGVKGGWTFLVMPPASAFHEGPGLVGRMSGLYKAFGESEGPISALGVKLANTSLGRAVLGTASEGVAEGGLWRGLATAAQGSRSALGRMAANAIITPMGFFDGGLKFSLATEGAMEAAQYANYVMRENLLINDADKGDFASSEHMQNLAAAHQFGLSMQQAAFMAIPTPNHYSPQEIRQSIEQQTAIVALQDAGQMNRLLEAPVNDTIDVPIKWYHAPLDYLLGKRSVQIQSSEGLKSMAAEMLLRARGTTLPELMGLQLIPETVAKGLETQANYQKYWSFKEARKLARGEAVAEPAARSGTQGNDAIYLIPEVKEVAARMIRERLLGDPKTATAIRRANGELSLDGVMIEDPAVISRIQEKTNWILFDAEAKTIEKNVMAAMRRAEAKTRKLEPEKLADAYNNAIDSVVASLKRRGGESAENQIAAIEAVRKPMKTDMALLYIHDYLDRQIRKNIADPAKRAEVKETVIGAIEQVLQWGDIVVKKTIDPSTGQPLVIRKLRAPQKVALEAWVEDVLGGKGAGEAGKDVLRTFTFLEASGGKTLLTKIAFMPMAKIRANRRGREVWWASSNETLAAQFVEDWESYSGGRRPDFKTTGLDEAMFQEVFAVGGGDASVGAKYDFVIDEGDHAFGKPQHSMGKPRGGLTDVEGGNPLLEVLERNFQRVRGRAEALAELRTINDDFVREVKIRQLAAEMAPEAATEWRRAMSDITGLTAGVARSLKKGLSKVRLAADPGAGPSAQLREEAKNAATVILEEYGLLQFRERRPGESPVEYAARRLNSDGVETFMRHEIAKTFKWLLLEDRSPHMRMDEAKAKVVPVFNGSEMPTLATEYRGPAQLDLLAKAREKDASRPSGVRFDFELAHDITLSLNDILRRWVDAGADMMFTSGTASRHVQNYLADLGVAFVNKEGQTRLPDRVLEIVGEDGMVTRVEPGAAGAVQNVDLSNTLSAINVTLPEGASFAHPRRLQLILHRAREVLADNANGKSLVILAPRTDGERQAMEAAIVASGLAAKNEIVRFFPGNVERKVEGYEMQDMIDQNNVAALGAGTAKVVLLVPEVGGRGVDLPFRSVHLDGKQYRGTIAMIGVDPHKVPVIEDTQAKARPGPGRVIQAETGPNGAILRPGAKVLFIDIASREGLLADRAYLNVVGQHVRDARTLDAARASAPDATFEQKVRLEIKKLLPTDEKALEALENPSSPEFKAFAARGAVYRALLPVMQENAQLEANQSSGIMEPDKNAFGKLDMQTLGIGASLGLSALLHSLGYGPMVSLGGGSVVMQAVNALANRFFPERPRTAHEAPMVPPSLPSPARGEGEGQNVTLPPAPPAGGARG